MKNLPRLFYLFAVNGFVFLGSSISQNRVLLIKQEIINQMTDFVVAQYLKRSIVFTLTVKGYFSFLCVLVLRSRFVPF